MRFYCSWIQDCAYAAMHCHTVFEAENLEVARRDWRSIIVSNHISCCPAYGNKYEELWALPAFLQDKTKAEIQDFYGPPEVCSFKHGDQCYATTRDRPQGCGKAHQPYGCYQQRHEEWVAKWGEHKHEVAGPSKWRDLLTRVRSIIR